tara:strand:+ start:2973 stop:3713 length:741 start_codon:yes stop_codon:yes gene_type:complete
VPEIENINLIDVSIPRTSIFVIPNQTSIPNTKHITRDLQIPAITMPCVEIRRDGLTSKQLTKDDPKNNLTINCAIPTFTPMVYDSKKVQPVPETPIPQPPDPPSNNLDNTEVADIPEITKDPPCPDPKKNNPRIGDYSTSGNEVVIGFKYIKETKECIVEYRPTSVTEKYLPSINTVSNTFAITTIAVTATTLAAPLLTKIVKPIAKQIITKIKAFLLKKKPIKLTKEQIMTNKYREKKNLPPAYK